MYMTGTAIQALSCENISPSRLPSHTTIYLNGYAPLSQTPDISINFSGFHECFHHSCLISIGFHYVQVWIRQTVL